MHKLHNLKKALLEELEMFADKGINNDTDLKRIDMMAHAAKNLGKVIEMCEEESGSSFRSGSYRMNSRSYGDSSYGDSSYRRRRDSMGRYAGDDGRSYESGYAEAADDMRGKLENLMREARTEEERHAIRGMLDQLG
jgi:hypothetical protein